MARTRVIAFDVGGTLIYPVDPIGETYAKVAKQYGCSGLDCNAINDAFPAALAAARKGTVPSDGNDQTRWKEVVRKCLPTKSFQDEAKFTAYFRELYDLYAKPDMWGVYPEVIEVLQELNDRGLDLVIVSNWDNRLHKVLDGLGLGEFFSQRFISAELGWEKPDAAIFRHVADVLRVDAGSLVAVGDDAKNDVEAAKKAGWKAVLIARPRHDLWHVKSVLGKR